VNSALHRAREAMAGAARPHDEPPAEAVQAFVRAWQTRDVDGLVALLRRDVDLSMPPHEMWLRGLESVAQFLRSDRFAGYWAGLTHVTTARANGLPALLFHRPERRSVMVVRWTQGQVAEMTVFVGDRYTAQFRDPHLS
jgi:RNA polymerase sigma-70 factor (ECF subfamily)